MRDFFISYTHADEQWAEWIAATLTAAGYTHYFQKWDFRPAGNFVLLMQKAMTSSKRTLLVMSKNYLKSVFTQPEFAAAFATDPTGSRRTVLPVRVESCEMVGLFKSIIYLDIFGIEQSEARKRLLAGIALKPERSKRPVFPGSPAPEPDVLDDLHPVGLKLQSVLETAHSTFKAQAELRDDLSARIHKRFRIRSLVQFEDLFEKYFDRLSPAELKLHGIIRTYTGSVMYEYNKRALKVLETYPGLTDVLPSYGALRHHLKTWITKFNLFFKKNPAICLLYVGVKENAPFPSAIDDELSYYLRTGESAPIIASKTKQWPSSGPRGRESRD
jgi:hypothetical protein